MPSSSLFLRSSTTLVSVLSLLSPSFAAPTSPQQVYSNVQTYSGADFENLFDFWDSSVTPDPNNGFVDYVPKQTAIDNGLVGYDSDYFYMAVDAINIYSNTPGNGRPSVRLTSQASYDKGLFVLNLGHMPGGVCGVWPAFWTLGANVQWPYGGEIDIVEGVNNRAYSLAALHDAGQSVIAGDSRTMTGSLQSTNCQYDVSTGGNSEGCVVLDTDTSAYGAGLNNAGGSIVAMEWTDAAIKIWHFGPNSAPADLSSANPNPSGWGLPTQIFNGPNANIASNILAQNIVINTNFCGDFGNAVWSSEGCASQTGYSTCDAYVAANPNAFSDEYWAIASLKIYSLGSPSVSTTSSSSSTTSSTTTWTTPTTTSTSTSSSTTTWTTPTTTSSTTTWTTPTTSSSTTTWTTPTTSSSTTWTTPTTSSSTTTWTTPTTSSSTTWTTPTTSSSTTTTWSFTTPTTFSTTTWTTPSSSTTWSFPSGTSTWTTPSGTTTWTTPSVTSTPAYASGSWAAWTTASFVASPVISTTGSVIGFPMGGGADPSSWSAWTSPEPLPTFITTTITTTFVVPCPTGWETSTVSIVTSYAGGKPVTYLPTAPVTTYTTSVPAGWGLGSGPITVTIPITTTRTIVVSGAGATGANGNNWGSGSGSGSDSFSSNSDGNNWDGSDNSPDATSASASAWNTWSTPAATVTATTATWAVPDGASATGSAASWDPWTGSSTASATTVAASASATWGTWSNSNVADPIATFTGAASRTHGGIMAMIGAAVVAVLLM